MASAHLSEDPLRLVFDHILGDGYARRLLPLLTVSKRWKELVTPLFFKRIALTSESNMDAAAAAIRKHEGHGNHVGGFIRRLDLEQIPLDARSTRIKASFIDRAAALILHAVNVEHLSLPVQASPVCFALASQHRTLRMLDATITGDNYEGLRYLSAMHGLRQLYIQFWDEPWKRLFDIPEDLDLKLDHLWDINWIDLTNGGSHARFLKSCRFADLTWMDFLEYNLRDERESKDIAAFLRSHPVIVHCAIPLREMAVRHILPDFSHPCLGLRIATEDAPIAMHVVMQCLEQLLEPDVETDIHTVALHFDLRLGAHFTWRDATQEGGQHALLAANLIAFALRLEALEIGLVDQRGASALDASA